MKKIILTLCILLSGISFSQYYPGDNGWGDDYYEYEDDYYFPDDYYYEYPRDYYSNSFYRSFYSDYRRSISRVDWERFFYEYNLSPRQIRLIIELNRQFDSYYVWESYYRVNPARWYYDRFYALERILGPHLFMVFQTQYYNGVQPVVYYTHRFHNYYQVRYRVRYKYRRYNPNRFRIDRYYYHQNNGRRYGWRENRRGYPYQNQGLNNGSPYRTDNNGRRVTGSSGFRNDSNRRTNNNDSGFRNDSNRRGQRNNSGFRNNSTNSNKTNTRDHSERGKSSSASSNGGYRNSSSSAGRRTSTSNQRDSASSSNQRGDKNTSRR